MKLIFITLCLLSLVHNEHCSLVATANLHIDSAQVGIGTLLFHQRDPASPVRIVGIIDGLKSNTVHVSSLQQHYTSSHIKFRVFMFTEIHWSPVNSIVLLLVLTSTYIVNVKHAVIEIFFFQSI